VTCPNRCATPGCAVATGSTAEGCWRSTTGPFPPTGGSTIGGCAARGAPLGTSLVLDSLWWSQRRGTRTVAVNTQEHNHRALALYQRLGFRRCPDGLAVLARTLDPVGP